MKTGILIVSSLFTIWTNMYGEIGCMDNSERLKKSGDPKSYHYVACTCPCSRYKQIADRSKCTKCNHFHDIKPYVIISDKNQNNAENSFNSPRIRLTDCRI